MIVGQVTLSVKLASEVAPQLSVARMVMTKLPTGLATVNETTPLLLTEMPPVYPPVLWTLNPVIVPLSVGALNGLTVRLLPATTDCGVG